jgi:UTP--glucose-1-phosphate uridylyltransferase
MTPARTRRPIRKAVFPVAGLGTALLPATKAAPKELLPVVDKPLIHYAVDEALAAGAREMILVTGRSKRPIEDHFDKAYELEAMLALQKRHELLAELRGLFPRDVTFAFVRQPDQYGLCHAIACARPLVGAEPFLVIVPDELADAPVPPAAQLVQAFARAGTTVLGVGARGDVDSGTHGYVAGSDDAAGTLRVTRASTERGRDAMPLSGRYVFTAEAFEHLEAAPRARHGDGDMVAALQTLLAASPVHALELEGVRFDCGSKLGFLAATLHFGLRHPVLGRAFADIVRRAGHELADLGRLPALPFSRPLAAAAG